MVIRLASGRMVYSTRSSGTAGVRVWFLKSISTVLCEGVVQLRCWLTLEPNFSRRAGLHSLSRSHRWFLPKSMIDSAPAWSWERLAEKSEKSVQPLPLQ